MSATRKTTDDYVTVLANSSRADAEKLLNSLGIKTLRKIADLQQLGDAVGEEWNRLTATAGILADLFVER